MKTQKNKCSECAGNPVNHFSEKFMVIINVIILPLVSPLEWIGRVALNLIPQVWRELIIWNTARILTRLKLGKLHTKSDEKNSWRTKCLWEEADKRGIHMYEFRLFNLPTELFFAQWKNVTRAFESLPRPIGKDSSGLSWMDDKGIMRKKFIASNLPVARGGVARTHKQAIQIFEKLTKPVITKPSQGSRSRHTTIHINTKNEFIKGFESAKKLSPWVVIEEELIGDVYRGTLIDKKLVAIMRREQPHVICDGVLTVRELMEKENSRSDRKGPIFHEIPFGVDADEELKRQRLTLDSVPQKGVIVVLHQKVGRSTGASTTDVTEQIHHETKEILEKIAEVLDDPLIGVDFIVEDISKPWSKQPLSGVLECNSLPFIDIHHYPLNGSVRNVAGALWDLIYPTSKST